MLNYIWAGMLLVGILYALFTGNMEAVSNACLEYAESAVTLCITMAGAMALWVGLMEIAGQAGLIEKFTRTLQPFISFLFPDVPENWQSRRRRGGRRDMKRQTEEEKRNMDLAYQTAWAEQREIKGREDLKRGSGLPATPCAVS